MFISVNVTKKDPFLLNQEIVLKNVQKRKHVVISARENASKFAAKSSVLRKWKKCCRVAILATSNAMKRGLTFDQDFVTKNAQK